MVSVFNPTEFLNATHQGGFITRRPNVPEGEYPGQIVEGEDGIKVKAEEGKNGVFYVLTVNWELIDERAKEATGLDKPRVKQDIFLDLDANGHLILDKTHNAQLGALLAGLGLNTETFTFAQLRTVGLCKLKVGLGKPNDRGEQFNRVNAAVKFSGG